LALPSLELCARIVKALFVKLYKALKKSGTLLKTNGLFINNIIIKKFIGQ